MRQTGKVLDAAGVETKVVPEVSRQVVTPPTTSFSAIEKFKKRYGSNPAEPPKKMTKTNAKKNETQNDTVNDFADIDKLLLSVAKIEQDVVGQSEPQGNAGLIVASEKPFRCGSLKVNLVQGMESVVNDYGSVVELDGEDAIAAVEKSCPDIGRFEVSKVLRFGDGVPAEKKDAVLAYFAQMYDLIPPPLQWNRIAYFAGGINFVFGKKLANNTAVDPAQKAIQVDHAINTDFILPRWLRGHIEKIAEGLPPLSAKEVQRTVNLTRDDVQRYARTYLPRSCAEMFVILDWVLGGEKVKSDISVLDVGCGSGGAALGCLLAIHKHSTGTCSIKIHGVDVNDHSLSFAEQVFRASQNEIRDDKIVFEPIKEDISNGITTTRRYDVVIASKSIGELALLNDANVYAKIVRQCADKTTEEGVLLVVDIPKHESLLQGAVVGLKNTGFDGWCRRMSIAIDGGKDEEDYVCACVTRRIVTTGNKK